MTMKTKIESLEDLYRTDPVKACRTAPVMTTDLSGEKRMDRINALLKGYGVEAIRGEWQNGYWCDIVADYVNMGDTYNLTVLRIRQDSGGEVFRVSSCGDWVERNQERLSIQ